MSRQRDIADKVHSMSSQDLLDLVINNPHFITGHITETFARSSSPGRRAKAQASSPPIRLRCYKAGTEMRNAVGFSDYGGRKQR